MKHLIAMLPFVLGLLVLPAAPAAGNVEPEFEDVADDHVFAKPIGWMRYEGITAGCNPPHGSRFCPDQPVTRGQIAAFLVRVLGLQGDAVPDSFVDDNGSLFETEINLLAAAGVTRGCNPPDNDRFCPTATLTRGQMAALLTRAYSLPPTDTDWFVDDDGSLFEDDINRLARAAITVGCDPPNNTSFCPNSTITRGQVAALLWRAAGSPIPGATARLVAAGDIARCELDTDEATALLLDELLTSPEHVVAALGDTVYDSGTPEEYADCYDESWGRHKSQTRPAVGNHEYRTSGATGYYDYFGTAAGNPAEGWYKYEAGPWQVLVLNTNCDEVGCGTDSPQAEWLRNTLETDSHLCSVAYMHHPRFSSGRHGDDAELTPLWQLLADHNVDIALAGHDHHYERLGPMSPDGLATADGTRSFVVGTGGTYLRPVETPRPVSEVIIDDTHGVLVLDLSESSYEWAFIDVDGNTRDAGTGTCQ